MFEPKFAIPSFMLGVQVEEKLSMVQIVHVKVHLMKIFVVPGEGWYNSLWVQIPKFLGILYIVYILNNGPESFCTNILT